MKKILLSTLALLICSPFIKADTDTAINSAVDSLENKLALIAPYAASGLENEERILDSPLEKINIADVNSILEIATFLTKYNDHAAEIADHARQVKGGCEALDSLKAYVTERLYSQAEEQDFTRWLSTLSEQPTFNEEQRQELSEALALNSSYRRAMLYFSPVTETLNDNTELRELIALKSPRGLIKETLSNILDSEVNAPRVALIKNYPRLYNLFNQYVDSLMNGDTEQCAEITAEIDNALDGPAVATPTMLHF